MLYNVNRGPSTKHSEYEFQRYQSSTVNSSLFYYNYVKRRGIFSVSLGARPTSLGFLK